MVIRAKTIIICLLAIAIAAGFVASVSAATFNQQLNYQGKLTNGSSMAVADGNYNFKFYLCTSGADCSGSPVWAETYCDSGCDGGRVAVASGLFSIMLGQYNATLDAVNFNQPLYLEVEVGGSSATPAPGDWETLSPSKELGAVPAAFQSSQLEGKTWEAPGAIGSTTPATGTFSFLTGNTLKVGTAYTFPTADGASGYYLQTNGSGTLGWAAASQTPWTSDIDGGGFNLNNVTTISFLNANGNVGLTTYYDNINHPNLLVKDGAYLGDPTTGIYAQFTGQQQILNPAGYVVFDATAVVGSHPTNPSSTYAFLGYGDFVIGYNSGGRLKYETGSGLSDYPTSWLYNDSGFIAGIDVPSFETDPVFTPWYNSGSPTLTQLNISSAGDLDSSGYHNGKIDINTNGIIAGGGGVTYFDVLASYGGTVAGYWDIGSILGNGQKVYNITAIGTGTFGGFKMTASPVAGYVLTSDVDGNGTWQAASGGVTGSGTSGYNAYWSGTNILGSEQYVATSRGGTGADWSAVATGSLPYFSDTGSLNTLAAATSGYVFTAQGANTAPAWAAAAGGGWTVDATYNNIYTNTVGAGAAIATGTANFFAGYQAGAANNYGSDNIFLGYQAGKANTYASKNIAIGTGALYTQSWTDFGTTYDTSNVAVGYKALYANQPTSESNGYRNSAFGTTAIYSNTTGSENTGIGFKALYYNSTGKDNFAGGMGALYTNSTGNYNTAVGSYALYNNDVGTSDNTAIGYNALKGNSYGAENVAIGSGALYTQAYTNSTTAWNTGNTAIGYKSLYLNNPTANTNGMYNTALGFESGYDLTTGNYNIALGSYIDLPSNTANGQLNIGNLIYGTGMYQTASMSSTPVTGGAVGIENSAPGALLDLGTAGVATGTMRFEGITSGYVQLQPAAAAGSWTMTFPPTAGTSGYFLQTDGAGVTTWQAAGGGWVGTATSDLNMGGYNIANAGTFNGLTLATASTGFTIAGGDTSKTLTVAETGTAALGTGASSQLAYWSGTNTLTSSSDLTYDGTTLTAGAGSEVFTVLYNGGSGEVGINNATPSYAFDVIGQGKFSLGLLLPSSATPVAASGAIYNNGTDIYAYESGWINLTNSSSLRFKHDITPLANDWSKLLQVQPVSFTYNNDPGNTKNIGYIAEDFDALGLNDLVRYDSTGLPSGINYEKISLYDTEIIKQQQLDINAIKKQLGMSVEDMTINPAGTVASGSLSFTDISPFDQSIAASLSKLGATLSGGIMSLKQIIADSITVKTAKVNGIEMIDHTTGEVYCTWINNGEMQKAKGNCADVILAATATPAAPVTPEPIVTPLPPAPPQEQPPQSQTQEPLDVSSVHAIDDINVAYGTAVGAFSLPINVDVTLSDNSVQNMGLVWDNGTPTYDPNTSGTYLFQGAINLQPDITNTNNMTARVNVIVGLQPPPPPPEESPAPAPDTGDAAGNLIQGTVSSLLNGVKIFFKEIFSSSFWSSIKSWYNKI